MGASDVGFVFVVNSVFVEPVVHSNFEVDVVSEVARTRTSNEKVLFVGHGVVVDELLGGPLVILRDQPELVSVA